MKGFNLTSSSTSLRAASEPNSFKLSAKGFSLKKASLNFHKSTYFTPRRSHDGFTSNSAPLISSAPARASTHIPESPYGGDVICISRESMFDSSNADKIFPDELQAPSTSPYASSSSSSSSSSYHLPPEIETDNHSLSPVDEALGECDPRRGSQLSVISSWVDHHLQELDVCCDEDGVYEIEIFTTGDNSLSRKDSFILPPNEAIQPYQQKRNLPDVPAKQFARLSRPLPCTPPASPGFNSQSRRIRPLPPPPS